MKYKTMRSVFHEGKISQEAELSARFALPTTRRLGFALGDDELFFTMTSEIYDLLLEAAKLDKKITVLASSLPRRAVSSYTESTLIDEIVLTNNIEGVHSSRREISEVLESLKEQDRSGRFFGLVQKYVLLSSGQRIPLSSCEDIRSLYDDLVLDEVVQAKKSNLPDGALFRAGTVDVCDGAGRPIHSGVHPEEKIIRLLEKSLGVLNDESIETIVRAALFHYLFGCVHPFYDGNGRMNRFISSYVIAQEYEPIIGLRLSYSIKENIQKYYAAYTTCEHALNRGDLTPFVIAFCEIVTAAMRDMAESLLERKDSLDSCEKTLAEMPECRDSDIFSLGCVLVTATLFSSYGLTAVQLGEVFDISRQTVYKRLEPFKTAGLLLQKKVGRKLCYSLSLEELRKRGRD
ncbi:MAG: Fic family protein [Eggerthellaceae bacterium]|nr:Fic family protein [Eggerthellaceae bacterium]